jgi:putative transposase
VIDACVAALEPLIGTGPACRAAGKSKATHYRRQRPAPPPAPHGPRPSPANALSAKEVEAVLATLRSERFRDLAPAQVWAILLDEDCYLCSISTMYRTLRATGEVHERRAQAAHPSRARPELMASAPNQCWSWDITKLRGPDKGVWFDLYVVIDIFSRYVVDWMVAPGESAELAEAFLARAAAGQDVKPGTLNIHADRGTSMTSKGVAELLADLGIGRTHSRPHVSNDNPFSESAFKTLKYCPAFPARFGSLADARVFCEQFFSYYNHEHRSHGVPDAWRDVA